MMSGMPRRWQLKTVNRLNPAYLPLPGFPRPFRISSNTPLAGKVAIITGITDSAGIGRATAILFAEGSVTAVYLCAEVSTVVNDRWLEVIGQDLQRQYPEVAVHMRALGCGHRVERVVDDVMRTYGHLDVVVAYRPNEIVSGNYNSNEMYAAIEYAMEAMKRGGSEGGVFVWVRGRPVVDGMPGIKEIKGEFGSVRVWEVVLGGAGGSMVAMKVAEAVMGLCVERGDFMVKEKVPTFMSKL